MLSQRGLWTNGNQTSAYCLDAAWQTGGRDELDRDRCGEAGRHTPTHTQKSCLPRGSQRLTRFHCTGYQSGGPIYRGPRPPPERKHLSEVGYQQTTGTREVVWGKQGYASRQPKINDPRKFTPASADTSCWGVGFHFTGEQSHQFERGVSPSLHGTPDCYLDEH